MIRIRQLLPAATLALVTVPSFAQNWIEYIHRIDGFSVMFPGMPALSETTHRSAHGVEFPAKVYAVENSSGRYSMTVVNYTEAEQKHRERPDSTDASSGERFWVMDVRASVANAAQNFRRLGGEVTYDGWADVDKIEGHQLQITNSDQSRSFIAIHLHTDRLYILEGTVPQGYPPPGVFQQSLIFLGENGRRIRYTVDTDGQRLEVIHRDLGGELDGVTKIVVE